MHGQHNFNRHPLAPLGLEAHIYVPPDKRKTWGIKSHKGFYIGTSTEHYRYYKAYCTDTRAVQGSETMFFKHKYITSPTVTPADAIVQAAKQLTDALKGFVPPPISESGIEQIRKLTSIFTNDDGVAPTEGAHPPRVENTNTKNATEPGRKIEAKTPELIVASPTKITPLPDWFDGYEEQVTNQRQRYNTITQEDTDDQPAYNTRSKRRTTPTITQEALLAAIQMTTTAPSPKEMTARKLPLQLLCEMAGSVLDSNTGDLLEYRHLIRRPEYQEIWGNAFGKEIGRLAQGLPGIVDGTDTIDFIEKEDVPQQRIRVCTYAKIVASYRPEKADPNRIRITVGGDKINYPGDCGTPTADLLTVKLLLNSVISTKNAKFMTLDIANFYLCTPLLRKEYLKMRLTNIPETMIEHYNLTQKATPDGYVYVAIKKECTAFPKRAYWHKNC
jgi:hypothetical protein